MEELGEQGPTGREEGRASELDEKEQHPEVLIGEWERFKEQWSRQ